SAIQDKSKAHPGFAELKRHIVSSCGHVIVVEAEVTSSIGRRKLPIGVVLSNLECFACPVSRPTCFPFCVLSPRDVPDQIGCDPPRSRPKLLDKLGVPKMVQVARAESCSRNIL